MDTSTEDIRIRKVRVLGDRAKAVALEQGLGENDLVIVKTIINSLPQYEITKIEGSPMQYLQDVVLKGKYK